MIALLALLACAGPGAALQVADAPPVEVRSTLDGEVKGSGGAIVVQLEQDAAVNATIAVPEVYGLTFTPEVPRVEHLGDRVVTTTRYAFAGKPGHYEIPGFVAAGDGPAGPVRAESGALFVDISVKPVAVGKMVGIDEPAAIRRVPGWLKIGLLGTASLLVGGVWLAFRGFTRRTPPPVPEEPPDVLALRAWAAVRRDASLSDDERALALSRIFRDYTEVVLHFPAAKYSTTEILEHLTQLPHLEEGNLPRAKRLLRATDRVKYAGDQPKEELFDELDADLRAFVASTRPYTWSPR